MSVCNICGGEEFTAGPNGRLCKSGDPPRCANCRSLERQRSLYASLAKIPGDLLRWRRAIQFAPDGSLDPQWFLSFETSTFGGDNSIDLQAIDRPDDTYDFISLSMVLEFVPDDRKAIGELVRIGSDRCIIHNSSGSTLSASISTHHEMPHGAFGRYHYYGDDIEEHLELARHGLWPVRVRATDPVTGTPDIFHLFCRREDEAKTLSALLNT
jgi:hypothetical protein